MNGRYLFYKFFAFMRVIFLVFAAIANIMSFVLMYQENLIWLKVMKITVFDLCMIIIASMISGLIRKSIISDFLKTFLEKENLSKKQIVLMTEDRMLVEVEGKAFTVDFGVFKEGVIYTMTPAEIEVNGCLVDWNGNTLNKSIVAHSGWGKPLIKDCPEELEQKEDSETKEDTDQEI